MATYFISDLHLSPQHPQTLEQLLVYLQIMRQDAECLYILGDLFEYWIGDDALDSPLVQAYYPLIDALSAFSQTGIHLFFAHGNRDFLIGERFANVTACQLLAEETVIDLYGQRVLVMHGDSLCTDDIAYQQAKKHYRNPQTIAQLLSLSIPERIKLAEQLRANSQQTQQNLSATEMEVIMDVNQQAVNQAMQKADVDCLIHGHTHRLAIHKWTLAGKEAKRIVLGDWYAGKSSVLRCDEQGCAFLS